DDHVEEPRCADPHCHGSGQELQLGCHSPRRIIQPHVQQARDVRHLLHGASVHEGDGGGQMSAPIFSRRDLAVLATIALVTVAGVTACFSEHTTAGSTSTTGTCTAPPVP